MTDEVGGFYAYNLYNMCPVGDSKYGMNRALRWMGGGEERRGEGQCPDSVWAQH
jgi:hypothetical protein